ncbi:MAG: hypothetical protein K0S08_766 [Gammaproteobacteria bacterium]|jgi:hypothetical protein|nr:hypothetical protein [Gammaproteobacteria bacterium]
MSNLSLNEEAKAFARKISQEKIEEGFKPEALHIYVDFDGNPIYWRSRLKHIETGKKHIRPFYQENGKFKIGEPRFGNGKPLYQLSLLNKNLDQTVWITEGEFCADALIKLGLIATTSGGSTSAAATDWEPLKNQRVILWPDNDDAGLFYAKEATKHLQSLNCDVRWIDIEKVNLPSGGDCVDWLKIYPEATNQDVLALPCVNPLALNDLAPEEAAAVSEEEQGKKQSQASALVDFVISRVELFHDQNSEVYAQDLSTHETRRLDGRQFKDWLVANYYESTGNSPRDQSLREALSTLSGLARHKGKCHDVYIRVAQYEDFYFLDLAEPGQSSVIKIASGSWEVVNNPSVRFLRPETLRPLPEPIRDGSLSKFWEIINIPESDRLLVIAWLIECLRLDTPYPVLELIGEQGSAKSTTQKMLRRLIDPNACDLRAAPKTTEDIFVSAGINWLVSYENISHLSAPMQDALCVLATGGGYAKRKLYSDADESVINVKRPVVLNGIAAAITAQDLIDRTISIETPVINQRMEVTELWAIYETELPKFLGALLDIFAKALLMLPSIQLPPSDRPRLAEFVRLGMAIAEALGKPGGDFLNLFSASRQESIARTIDASPVASAVIEWFDSCERRSTILPIKSLYEQVSNKKPINTDAWPRSPKGFADALRRAAPALRQMDIECRCLGKRGSYIFWEIKQRE